jgi:hypothetical protein
MILIDFRYSVFAITSASRLLLFALAVLNETLSSPSFRYTGPRQSSTDAFGVTFFVEEIDGEGKYCKYCATRFDASPSAQCASSAKFAGSPVKHCKTQDLHLVTSHAERH